MTESSLNLRLDHVSGLDLIPVDIRTQREPVLTDLDQTRGYLGKHMIWINAEISEATIQI